jgi:hypothetical protein
MSRYFALYLYEQGVLSAVYNGIRDGGAKSAAAQMAIMQAQLKRPGSEIQADWERWLKNRPEPARWPALKPEIVHEMQQMQTSGRPGPGRSAICARTLGAVPGLIREYRTQATSRCETSNSHLPARRSWATGPGLSDAGFVAPGKGVLRNNSIRGVHLNLSRAAVGCGIIGR